MAKFQKGQSGNPGGRPKENNEVKELARQFTFEAIERLAFWMRSNEAKASVQSALAILDRGHGKPVQSLEHSGPDGGPIETNMPDDRSLARAIVGILQTANTKGEKK